MRAALTIVAAIFASGAATAAPDDALPMGPGSNIYWASAYDGGSDNFREALLEQGEDFAIFQSISDWAEGGPADYFTLFSGVFYVPCDADMPTPEERESIAGLYPLTTGNTASVATGDGASFTVGEATEFFLMGRSRPAHEIHSTYAGDEPSEETIIVLDDTPLTVVIQWDESSRDSARLITSPKSVASTRVDTDLIGTCASLLNKQTNEN